MCVPAASSSVRCRPVLDYMVTWLHLKKRRRGRRYRHVLRTGSAFVSQLSHCYNNGRDNKRYVAPRKRSAGTRERRSAADAAAARPSVQHLVTERRSARSTDTPRETGGRNERRILNSQSQTADRWPVSRVSWRLSVAEKSGSCGSDELMDNHGGVYQVVSWRKLFAG